MLPSMSILGSNAISSPPPPVVLFGQPGPLPALDVADRLRYRQRNLEEKEEAVWYHTNQPNALAGPEPVRLRSVHSKQASVIRFTNRTPRNVRALWIDFDGNEVAYSVVEPNQQRLYRTYVSHPWIVREVSTGARMVLSGAVAVVGMAQEQCVDITDPPMLGWEIATHRCFPDQHKRASKAMLLLHHRLATIPLASHLSQLPGTATSPPCSPARCVMKPTPIDALAATTTTRLQLSTAQTDLSIAITTDSLLADCSPYRASSTQSVSPLSPRRTINITVNATGSSFGVNISSSLLPADASADAAPAFRSRDQDWRCSSASSLAPLSPASSSKHALTSGFKSGLSTIMGLVSPSRSRTPLLRRLDAAGCSTTPFGLAASGTNLGSLPEHLVLHIIKLAAPPQWQGVHLPPSGRRDIKPTLLACPPNTKTQKEEDEEAAAAAAADDAALDAAAGGAAAAAAQQQQQQAQQQAQQPFNLAAAALNAFINGGWNLLGPLGAAALGQAPGVGVGGAAVLPLGPGHGFAPAAAPEADMPGMADSDSDVDE